LVKRFVIIEKPTTNSRQINTHSIYPSFFRLSCWFALAGIKHAGTRELKESLLGDPQQRTGKSTPTRFTLFLFASLFVFPLSLSILGFSGISFFGGSLLFLGFAVLLACYVGFLLKSMQERIGKSIFTQFTHLFWVFFLLFFSVCSRVVRAFCPLFSVGLGLCCLPFILYWFPLGEKHTGTHWLKGLWVEKITTNSRQINTYSVYPALFGFLLVVPLYLFWDCPGLLSSAAFCGPEAVLSSFHVALVSCY